MNDTMLYTIYIDGVSRTPETEGTGEDLRNHLWRLQVDHDQAIAIAMAVNLELTMQPFSDYPDGNVRVNATKPQL